MVFLGGAKKAGKLDVLVGDLGSIICLFLFKKGFIEYLFLLRSK
jgi:hypothetical protein